MAIAYDETEYSIGCGCALKLNYWKSELNNNRGHWRGEIINFRQLIKDELVDSPSLRGYLATTYEACYQNGRIAAAERSQLPLSTFPEKPIATLEQLLDEDWLP